MNATSVIDIDHCIIWDVQFLFRFPLWIGGLVAIFKGPEKKRRGLESFFSKRSGKLVGSAHPGDCRVWGGGWGASDIERPFVCKPSALSFASCQFFCRLNSRNVQYSLGFGLSRELCGLLVAERKRDRISFYSSYRVWRGIFGILDLTKIHVGCVIWGNATYLNGKRDFTATWEAGFVQI